MKELILMCLIIFIARTAEVIISTMTTIFIAKANMLLASVFGFIQTVVYITVLKVVMDKLSNPIVLIVYSFAYAMGVALAIYIEGRLALGDMTIQAVIGEDKKELIKTLRDDMHLIVTVMEAQGRHNEKRLVLLISVKRKKMMSLVKFFRENKVFVTVNSSINYLNIK